MSFDFTLSKLKVARLFKKNGEPQRSNELQNECGERVHFSTKKGKTINHKLTINKVYGSSFTKKKHPGYIKVLLRQRNITYF